MFWDLVFNGYTWLLVGIASTALVWYLDYLGKLGNEEPSIQVTIPSIIASIAGCLLGYVTLVILIGCYVDANKETVFYDIKRKCRTLDIYTQ